MSAWCKSIEKKKSGYGSKKKKKIIRWNSRCDLVFPIRWWKKNFHSNFSSFLFFFIFCWVRNHVLVVHLKKKKKKKIYVHFMSGKNIHGGFSFSFFLMKKIANGWNFFFKTRKTFKCRILLINFTLFGLS